MKLIPSKNLGNGEEKSKLTRNVILLGLVSFIADFSSELYFAILPFFILSIGGTGLAVGIVIGVSDGFLSFLKALFGLFSDKLASARKKFLYWGYGLPSIFKYMMAFVTSWPLLIFVRMMERFGKGIRTAPRDALITENSEPLHLGRAFGFHRAMDSFGAVIGSITALILIYIGISFKMMFIISSGIALLTIIPIKLVRDKKIVSHQNDEKMDARDKLNINFNDFLTGGTTGGYWQVVLVGIFHSISLLSYAFFLLLTEPLNFNDILYINRLNSIEIGVLFYILFNITYTLTSYVAGILADKKSKVYALKYGFSIYWMTLLLFILAESFFGFVIGFILLGVSYGFTQGNIRAIIADQIEPKYKATGYGVFHGLTGLSILLGNVIAGILFDINPSFSFIFGNIAAIIALISLFKLKI